MASALQLEDLLKVKQLHPTARALIDSTLELLETHAVYEVTLEQVLEKSSISVGSLYHHFKDFPELMDFALVEKYVQFTKVNVEGMAHVLETAKSAKDYHDKILKLLEFTHSVSNSELRKMRAYILSQATIRPDLGVLIRGVQSELTNNLCEIIGEAQKRGWIQPIIKPVILATFIQAYGIGRIVDDLADSHMDNDEWIAFLQHVIGTSVLIA